MKVGYALDDRFTFEFDVTTPREAFEQIAAVQDVFSEDRCGMCHSLKIRCDVREHDGNTYYKLRCDGCGATLDFGQNRDGARLFPKRLGADGNPDETHRGWYKYWERKQNARAAGEAKDREAYLEEVLRFVQEGAIPADFRQRLFAKTGVSDWEEMTTEQLGRCLAWARDRTAPV